MPRRPQHIRHNLRFWATVILPRVKVHAMVYTLWLLDRPRHDS
jgi:hypothetical protein